MENQKDETVVHKGGHIREWLLGIQSWKHLKGHQKLLSRWDHQKDQIVLENHKEDEELGLQIIALEIIDLEIIDLEIIALEIIVQALRVQWNRWSRILKTWVRVILNTWVQFRAQVLVLRFKMEVLEEII